MSAGFEPVRDAFAENFSRRSALTGAVEAAEAGFVAQYRTASLTLADREVLLGNGWAVELGTFEWGLTPAAGGASMLDRGNYMQVWQQQSDQQWRFAREVYNSSVPPAPGGAQ